MGPDGNGGNMKLYGAAAERGEHRAKQCVKSAALRAVLLCLNQGLLWALRCADQAVGARHVLGHWVKEWLLVGAAMSPALAAFFVISVEKRAYEAHAYGLMGRMFDQALRDTEHADAETFRAFTLEIAREALAENAEWLLERRRRIDYTPGA